MATSNDLLAGLEQLPVSEVKKRGWKGVMRLVGEKGAVVVTNHEQPDAVVVPVAEYARLRDAAILQAKKIKTGEESLREEWKHRLATLNQPRGRKAMDKLLRGPIRLGGAVKAGEGW